VERNAGDAQEREESKAETSHGEVGGPCSTRARDAMP
jgi:hypothetical protein